MPKRRTLSAKQRKNTFVDYFICIGGAAALFLMGFVEILGGRAEIGGTRRIPGREVFGEEAWTMGAAHVAVGSILLLWLCRHRSWHFAAICAALVGNVIVIVLAFTQA